jgi:hypothetical protein
MLSVVLRNDQGWGNQKGNLYARLAGSSEWLCVTPNPAPHDKTKIEVPIGHLLSGESCPRQLELGYSVGARENPWKRTTAGPIADHALKVEKANLQVNGLQIPTITDPGELPEATLHSPCCKSDYFRCPKCKAKNPMSEEREEICRKCGSRCRVALVSSSDRETHPDDRQYYDGGGGTGGSDGGGWFGGGGTGGSDVGGWSGGGGDGGGGGGGGGDGGGGGGGDGGGS